MNIWLVWDGEYENSYVVAAFDTKAAADMFARGREVAQITLWHQVPPPWKYWHAGAEVYPDGHVVRWMQEHDGEGEITMRPVDDHQNEGRIWDGHTQGHCGEHISIFGTDKEACDAACEKHIATALARQDGVCHGGSHREPADGRTIFDAGFMRLRHAGSQETQPWECPHEWDEWSAWRDVGNDSQNRQRICRKCVRLEIGIRSAVTAPNADAP